MKEEYKPISNERWKEINEHNQREVSRVENLMRGKDNTYKIQKKPVYESIFLRKEEDETHSRTIYIRDRTSQLLAIIQRITLGLGYLDYENNNNFDGKILHYEDSANGLRWHLREMDNRANIRTLYEEHIAMINLGELIYCVEDSADSLFETYEEIIRVMAKPLNKIIPEYSLQIEKKIATIFQKVRFAN